MTFTVGTPVRDRRRRGDEGTVIAIGVRFSNLLRVQWKNGSESWVVETRLEAR